MDTISQLPAVREMLAAAEQDVLDKRQAKIDSWRAQQAEDTAHLKHLNNACQAARAEAAKANDEYRRLLSISDQAHTAFHAASTRAHRRDTAARNDVLAGADRRIHSFMLWAQRAENLAKLASANALPLAFEGTSPMRWETAREHTLLVSSKARNAVGRAEEMCLEAISEANMLAELAELADGVRAAYAPLERIMPRRLPSDHFLSF